MVDTLAVETVAPESSDAAVGPTYERSPIDALRFAVLGLLTLALVGLMAWSQDTVLGLERDLIDLFSFLSPTVERILAGLLQIVVVLASVWLWLGTLLRRRFPPRWRLFGYLVVAVVVTGVAMVLIDGVLDRGVPSELVDQIEERAGIAHTGAGSTVSIAQLAAMLVVVGPFVSRRWRRAFVSLIVTVVVVRLTVAAHPPANVIVAIPLGAAIGAIVLFAFGRPGGRPTIESIRRALGSSGLAVAAVRPAMVDARGSTPYFATLDDGTGLFVKTVGADNRAAGLLFWAYRSLRLKNVGDEQPYSTLRRGVEHEAFTSLMARDIGIRTPRLRAMADLSVGVSAEIDGERAPWDHGAPDAMLLATEQIDGASLDSFEAESISDELLVDIWDQVAILRTHRMAHRDLRLANVFLADSGEAWLIDFGFAESAVDDDLLNADVAQLLASLTRLVGPERAVDSAISVLGPEPVADALPRLQLVALAGATQSAFRKDKEALTALQETAMERSGAAEVDYAELERLSLKTMVLLVALVGATYFLLPQLADLPSMIDQVKSADWSKVPWILLTAAGSFLGAALALSGSIPQRLPALPNFLAQLGASFAGKAAPAGLGSMALKLRFLQKLGIDPAVAVSGIGLNAIGGVVAHVSLSVVFIVWAGPDGFGSIEVPAVEWIVWGVLALLAGLVASLLFPSIRRLIREKLIPVVRRSLEGAADVVRSPAKVLSMVGGSALGNLSAIVGLYLASLAFGGGLPFATVGATYLLGSAVAKAVPTPGGIGAVEAALAAGLTAVGMDNAVAIPTVFLYRLCTFWLPILPAWLAFRWLQRNEYI